MVALEFVVEAFTFFVIDGKEGHAVMADADLPGLIGSVGWPAECRAARFQRFAPGNQNVVLVIRRDRGHRPVTVRQSHRCEINQRPLTRPESVSGTGQTGGGHKGCCGQSHSPFQYLASAQAGLQHLLEGAVTTVVGDVIVVVVLQIVGHDLSPTGCMLTNVGES